MGTKWFGRCTTVCVWPWKLWASQRQGELRGVCQLEKGWWEAKTKLGAHETPHLHPPCSSCRELLHGALYAYVCWNSGPPQGRCTRPSNGKGLVPEGKLRTYLLPFRWDHPWVGLPPNCRPPVLPGALLAGGYALQEQGGEQPVRKHDSQTAPPDTLSSQPPEPWLKEFPSREKCGEADRQVRQHEVWITSQPLSDEMQT